MATVMTVPLSILWRSRLPVRQKFALAGVFSLVLFTILVAVIRTGLTTEEGKAMNLPWVVVWTGVEANIGTSWADIPPLSNSTNAFASHHRRLRRLLPHALRAAS